MTRALLPHRNEPSLITQGLTSGPAYFLATSTSLITWLSRNNLGSTPCRGASVGSGLGGTEIGMVVCMWTSCRAYIDG